MNLSQNAPHNHRLSDQAIYDIDICIPKELMAHSAWRKNSTDNPTQWSSSGKSRLQLENNLFFRKRFSSDPFDPPLNKPTVYQPDFLDDFEIDKEFMNE